MDEIIYEFLSTLPTILLLVIIGGSLYILGIGADLLVQEAVGISVKLGIPKVVIGATIVSLGTTIPEVTVSVAGAINGSSDLAIGNAVGSIITNGGLIIGLSSLIGKIPIKDDVAKRQSSIQLGTALLLVFFSLPIVSNGNINKSMGFIFLLLLVFYMIYSFKYNKVDSEEEIDDTIEDSSTALMFVKLILGSLIVVFSSKVLIPSVELTAIRIGVPESIIAATLVAFGTSVPELVTAITAVKQGYGELALGNVMGANILNILFVVGASAFVSPNGLDVAGIFYKLQFPVMIIILSLFKLFVGRKNKEISKIEGIILFAIYIVYLILNYLMM